MIDENALPSAEEAREVENNENNGSEVVESPGKKTCCGRIELSEGVSSFNFCVMLLVSLLSINFLVFLNAMQGFLLRETFSVDSDDLGTTTGYLGLADELWSIITLAFWGVSSDKIGRRTVVALGFLQVGIASIIIPNAPRVFVGVLFARLLYAQGASALVSMISALLADYVKLKDLGKATGLVGLMSGLGALLAVFFFVSELPPNVCIEGAYYSNGFVALVMTIVSFFGLQSLKSSNAQNDVENEVEEKLGFFKMLKQGMYLAYKNRNLGLAYTSGFLARGNTVIGSIFISLWINQEFQDEGLCNLCVLDENDPLFDPNCTIEESSTTCGESLLDEDQLACPDAYTRFRILSGISQTAGLFVAPFVAVFADKFEPVDIVIATSVLSAVAYFLVFSIKSTDDAIAIVVTALWGVASISTVLSSQLLLVKSMPKERKGTIAGCFSVISALGVMFYSYLGGLLFDNWFFGAPFALSAFVSVAILLQALYVARRNKLEKKIAEEAPSVNHYVDDDKKQKESTTNE